MVSHCVHCSLWLRRRLNTEGPGGVMLKHITVWLCGHLWSLSAHHKADGKVTNTFCSSLKRFPVLQWEAYKQQASLPWMGSQFMSTSCGACVLPKGEMGRWGTSLQSFKTKRKTNLPQKYSLAPFAINRVYSVTKVLLVSICEPLSFPLLTGRLFGIYWASRAGDIFRPRSHVIIVFLTQKWRHNSDLPPKYYIKQVRHQRICVMQRTSYLHCCLKENFKLSPTTALILTIFWISGHDPTTCHGLPLPQCPPRSLPTHLRPWSITDLFYCFLCLFHLFLLLPLWFLSFY